MTPDSSPDHSFETALDQLTRIVADLEQGAPELATALAKYEQAIRLLAHCHSLIDRAEQTVALLTGVDDQGQPLTTAFDATATAPTAPAEREPAAPAARKVSPDNANPSRSPDNVDREVPF
jgi:exodeoxyribonuclease VII small subunit